MRAIRLLTALLGLGLLTTPCHAAALVYIAVQSAREIEFAQRDSAGNIISIFEQDSDSDGVIEFTTDFDPPPPLEVPILLPGGPAVHISSGPNECKYVYFPSLTANPGPASQGIPFLSTTTGGSLMVEISDVVITSFSIGQRVSVLDGRIAGIDGLLVHTNPGIPTAAGLLRTDQSTFPLFTGDADVVALMTLQVIPEPATAALLVALGVAVCACRRGTRRFANSEQTH